MDDVDPDLIWHDSLLKTDIEKESGPGQYWDLQDEGLEGAILAWMALEIDLYFQQWDIVTAKGEWIFVVNMITFNYWSKDGQEEVALKMKVVPDSDQLGEIILQVLVKPNENDPNLLILTIKGLRSSIPEREVMGVVRGSCPAPLRRRSAKS
jgi:hypothetical protein